MAFVGLGQHYVMCDQDDGKLVLEVDLPPPGAQGSSPEAASHWHVAFGK